MDHSPPSLAKGALTQPLLASLSAILMSPEATCARTPPKQFRDSWELFRMMRIPFRAVLDAGFGPGGLRLGSS